MVERRKRLKEKMMDEWIIGNQDNFFIINQAND